MQMNNIVLLVVVMMAVTVVGNRPASGEETNLPAAPATPGDGPKVSDSTKVVARKPKFKVESIRGQIVWFNQALKKRYGISTTEDKEKQLLALQTDKGQILPILEDLRGRSFRTDAHLRGKPMELLVRRYQEHPLLQVMRIYAWEKDQKFEVDYWCDVCAIVMFEKGFCACCQDQNRLRKRIVEDGVTAERD